MSRLRAEIDPGITRGHSPLGMCDGYQERKVTEQRASPATLRVVGGPSLQERLFLFLNSSSLGVRLMLICEDEAQPERDAGNGKDGKSIALTA